MLTASGNRRFAKIVAPVALSLLVFAAACGSGDPDDHPGVLTQKESKVSACGGFAKQGSPLFDAPPAYCDAEILHWQYEADTGTLSLADTRAQLNCCGMHGVSIAQQDGVLLVTETDDPQEGGARCSCMCVFDFSVTATGVSALITPIRIVRNVSDWPEGSGVVFVGNLDLAAGAGTEIIDNEASVWCQNQG